MNWQYVALSRNRQVIDSDYINKAISMWCPVFNKFARAFEYYHRKIAPYVDDDDYGIFVSSNGRNWRRI